MKLLNSFFLLLQIGGYCFSVHSTEMMYRVKHGKLQELIGFLKKVDDSHYILTNFIDNSKVIDLILDEQANNLIHTELKINISQIHFDEKRSYQLRIDEEYQCDVIIINEEQEDEFFGNGMINADALLRSDLYQSIFPTGQQDLPLSET